jgi:hypothetical protein
MADFTGYGGGLLDGALVDNGGMVLSDVSNGAPDQSPSTPTGNGSGYFIDTTTQNQIFGTIQKGLDYVLRRDQESMNTQAINAQAQRANAAVAVQKQQNSRTFLLIAGAAVLFMVLK